MIRGLTIGTNPVLAFALRLRRASRRFWLAVGLVGLIALGVGWLGYRWWTDWPAYAVLHSPDHTWALTFAPDGGTLVTAGADGITIWDVQTGRKRSTWSVPEGRWAYLGVFTPDGRTFAGLSCRTRQPLVVDIFDVATGEVRGSIPTRHLGMLGLAAVDGGRTIRAVGFHSGVPEVVDCDVASGKELSSRDLSCPIPRYPVALSDDGRIMAEAPDMASPQKGLSAADAILWDLDRDRELARFPAPPGGAEIVDLAFSHDGNTLALSRVDRSLELWDLATGHLRTRHQVHDTSVTPRQLTLSADGLMAASFAEHFPQRRPLSVRSLRTWASLLLQGGKGEFPVEMEVVDLSTGRRMGELEWEGRSIFSPDGRTLATSHYDGTALLRKVPRGRR